jgi:predicted Zn-dependent protease
MISLGLYVFGAKELSATLAEEIKLGREVHMEIAKEGMLFDDPYVLRYYQKVCNKLLKVIGPQEQPFQFHLILSDSLNAFAVPGGYIYFHTETFNSLENEGQMAAILAHEIAHITSKHFSLRAEKNAAASLANLAGLIAGAVLMSSGGHNSAALGQAVLMGSAGASVQSMLANSRADESEADRKGRSYMIKAGYNPRDMYGAFKIMNEKSFNISSSIPSYMSTHPGISQRLASTLSDQASAPKAPVDKEYLEIRDRVLALTANTERARNVFMKRLEDDPKDASALHALGLLAVRNMNFSQAEKYYKDALEIIPNKGEYLSDLGNLSFDRRKYDEAVKYFSDALKSGDRTPRTTLGLARSYELLGKNREASINYDAAVESAGNLYPQALEIAGLFFTTKGDQAKGHYILGNYYLQTGRPREAVFHYQETLKLPNSQKYKFRVEQLLRDLDAFMGKPKEDKTEKETTNRFESRFESRFERRLRHMY